MKNILATAAALLFSFLAVFQVASAQATVYQGGTGTKTVPANYVLLGKDALHLTAVATSSLGIPTGAATSSFTATYPIKITDSTSAINFSLLNMSTTTVTCSGSVSCTSFTVIGTSPITITSSGGAASTTLLSDNNTFSGNNLFSASTTFSTLVNIRNASTTQSTLGTAWFPNITAYNLIATDVSNKAVATSSIGNSLLANSTISGISLGSTLGALSATDATLTFSGSYTGATARTVGVNLGNTNIWTALQNQANTGTTTFSGGIEVGGKIATPYIMATSTATSTFAGGLNITGNDCYAQLGTCLQTFIQNATAYKQAVSYATAAILAGTPSYANGTSGVGATLTEVGFGALVVDGQNPTIGQRVLIKDQAAQLQNGIYTVTAVGSGIAAYILTRATDYNTSADIYAGTTVPVLAGGTANADTQWTETTTGTITVGSTAIAFEETAFGTTGPTSVSNSDGTLTVSPTTGAVVASIVLGHSNIWSALQLSSNTGTTTFSGGIESGTKIAAPYFNATSSTATSTFNGGIKSPCFSNDGIACIPTSSGTVTSIATTNGISGGTITSSGTLKLTSYTATSTADTSGQVLFFTSTNSSPATFGGNSAFSFSTAGSTLLTVTNASTTNLTSSYASSTNLLASVNLAVGATTTPWAAFSLVSATNPTFAVATTSGALPTFLINSSGGIQTQAWQPSTSTTITLDWSATPPQVEYQIGNAALSIVFINATTGAQWGSRKLVWICNVGGTAGALTWRGNEWIGTAPTQTTTTNQCDVYSFDITRATSTNAYKVAGSQGAGFQ